MFPFNRKHWTSRARERNHSQRLHPHPCPTHCPSILSGQLHLHCPLYLTQNDGTLTDASTAAELPIKTFASGPTNSMTTAAFLAGLDGGAQSRPDTQILVIDIGERRFLCTPYIHAHPVLPCVGADRKGNTAAVMVCLSSVNNPI